VTTDREAASMNVPTQGLPWSANFEEVAGRKKQMWNQKKKPPRVVGKRKTQVVRKNNLGGRTDVPFWLVSGERSPFGNSNR